MHIRLFGLLLLLACSTAYGQHADTLMSSSTMKDSIAKQVARLRQVQADMDSLQAHQLDRLQAEAIKRDSANMVRTMDEFMARKREEDKRMKKQLWIKGGMFAFMLAVTIVGVVRRRKQKVKG